FVLESARHTRPLHSFPTRRSSDLSFSNSHVRPLHLPATIEYGRPALSFVLLPNERRERARMKSVRIGTRTALGAVVIVALIGVRSEEHTSELQSRSDLVCRLLLEK